MAKTTSAFRMFFVHFQLKFYENEPQLIGVYETYEEALDRVLSEFDVELEKFTESNFQQCFHREWLTKDKSRRVFIKAYRVGHYNFIKN